MAKGKKGTGQYILWAFGQVASAAIDTTGTFLIDLEEAGIISFHVVWGAPTGAPSTAVNLTTGSSINANFQVVSSNIKLPNTKYPTLFQNKNGTQLNVTTSSGSQVISLNSDICTERYYAIKWDAGAVSGGTVACFAFAKG